MPDRNGGFPRLSDGPMLVNGAHGFRCSTSPRHALLAENLGKPSLGVIIKDLWYYWEAPLGALEDGDELCVWARDALGAARRAKAGKSPADR